MNYKINDVKVSAFRLLFFIFFFALLSNLNAQKFQLGGSYGLNSTIFHKGESVYDNRLFHTTPIPGIAVALPMYIRLDNSWDLKTGIGYQMKHYRIAQTIFDVPNLVGKMYFTEGFATAEVPLLICFKSRGDKKTKIEYSAGCIFSLNVPMGTGMGTSLSGSGSSQDDSISVSMTSNSVEGKSTFSPDLYVGISLVNFKEKIRKHQFTISYQYGLMPTSQFLFTTEVKSGSTAKVQNVVLKPTLSCVLITYTFFPGGWPFKN